MLRRIARIVGWQHGARGSQESQMMDPDGPGEAEDSTHSQLTQQNARLQRPRVQQSDSMVERSRILATVPEADELEVLHEDDPVVRAAPRVPFPATTPEAYAGFCRDHRGKLQSVWELCEDVAPEDCNDVQDADQDAEADDVLLAAAETRGDQNRVHRGARPARTQAQAPPLAASETPGPADRIVTGPLELRLSATATRRRKSHRPATCTIQHGVMTFLIRRAEQSGAETALLAAVPVSDTVATIVPDQTRKFSICNPEDIDGSQVWCCAKDQVNRDKWLAVLHRLGVDLYCEDDDGVTWRVRQGVQASLLGLSDLLWRGDDDVEDGTLLEII